jgi:hypothetical protein
MKLLKNWQWREDAIIYTRAWEVVHQPYPFYYYLVDGLKIELRKQVSKYCAVIQDENSFIEDQPVKEVSTVDTSSETMASDIYVDHRSWLTLGEVPHDPIDQISEFTWGNATTKMEFTGDGKLYSIRQYLDSKIIYVGQFNYNKKKDRYFVSGYQNSLGVNCKKIDTGWDWITGKPLIEKKYGKRK